MKKQYKILLAGLLILLIIWFIPIPGFIALKISLSNSVKGSAVGISGVKPAQYQRQRTNDFILSDPGGCSAIHYTKKEQT